MTRTCRTAKRRHQLELTSLTESGGSKMEIDEMLKPKEEAKAKRLKKKSEE